jgi:FtsH-binding integral membrane protein
LRSFGPDDVIEPVLSPLAAAAEKELPERRLGPALLLCALFLGVFAVFAFLADNGRTIGIAAAATAALVLVTSLKAFRNAKTGRTGSRELSPMESAVAGVLLILVTGAFSWNAWSDQEHFSAILIGGFGAAIFAFLVLSVLRGIQDKRIARAMRAKSMALPAAEAEAVDNAGPAEAAPRMRLDVYLQEELPELSHAYQPQVLDCGNIVGEKPQHILYLYNFFSSNSLRSKLQGGWRRFGPVYFLGSPQDISFKNTFSFSLKKAISSQLLESPRAFDEHLAAAQTAPLPAGAKELMGVAWLSGGYPQHLFLCTDASWRHGVMRLFALADVVIIDATAYAPARSGLNWEIGFVVDHIATEKFVVLVNSETDQVALGMQFREKWAAMRGSSPNNRPDAGPVRFVVLKVKDSQNKQRNTEIPAQFQSNPPGLRKSTCTILRLYLPDILEEDRIFGMFSGMRGDSIERAGQTISKAPLPAERLSAAPQISQN